MHVNKKKKKKIKKFVTSPVSFPYACACLSRRIRGGFKGGRGARLQYAEGKARPYPRPPVCTRMPEPQPVSCDLRGFRTLTRISYNRNDLTRLNAIFRVKFGNVVFYSYLCSRKR